MRAVCDAMARMELGYAVVRPDAADAADAAADPVRFESHLYNVNACTQEQAEKHREQCRHANPLCPSAGPTLQMVGLIKCASCV